MRKKKDIKIEPGFQPGSFEDALTNWATGALPSEPLELWHGAEDKWYLSISNLRLDLSICRLYFAMMSTKVLYAAAPANWVLADTLHVLSEPCRGWPIKILLLAKSHTKVYSPAQDKLWKDVLFAELFDGVQSSCHVRLYSRFVIRKMNCLLRNATFGDQNKDLLPRGFNTAAVQTWINYVYHNTGTCLLHMMSLVDTLTQYTYCPMHQKIQLSILLT